jgi:hypothetical protein
MTAVKVTHHHSNPYTTIVDMMFIVAIAVVFNFFPQVVGVYNLPSGGLESFKPFLAAEFYIVLPWLNIWWGLAFTLDVARLVRHRETFGMRWLDCGLHAYGAVLLGWLALDTRFLTDGVRAAATPLLALISLALLVWVAHRVSIARRGQQIVFELKQA